MLVKDIMTTKVEYVNNDATLKEAANKMKDFDIGELPVVMGREAVGIVTDRDIVVRGVAHGHNPQVATVVEVMTEGIVACREDDELERAAKTMSDRKVRRLPVLDPQGKLTGVISLGDLARSLDHCIAGETLTAISR